MLREIWIYKVKYPDGGSGYERKDDRLSNASSGAPTLFLLAKGIKVGEGVAIHFQPPYNLEIKNEFVPRLCLPLNKKEIQVVLDTLFQP